MGGANDEDLGALAKGLFGPARARDDLTVNGGGHGGLLRDAQFLKEGGEVGEAVSQGSSLTWTRMRGTNLPLPGAAGKRRFGIAGVRGVLP